MVTGRERAKFTQSQKEVKELPVKEGRLYLLPWLASASHFFSSSLSSHFEVKRYFRLLCPPFARSRLECVCVHWFLAKSKQRRGRHFTFGVYKIQPFTVGVNPRARSDSHTQLLWHWIVCHLARVSWSFGANLSKSTLVINLHWEKERMRRMWLVLKSKRSTIHTVQRDALN